VWDEWFIQMVLKMLLHCTPPSCIPPIILTFVNSLYNDPRINAVRQLPSVRTVREWRSVLVVVTKTLAAYQLGRADSYKAAIYRWYKSETNSNTECCHGYSDGWWIQNGNSIVRHLGRE
jgi:hypothetical protein